MSNYNNNIPTVPVSDLCIAKDVTEHLKRLITVCPDFNIYLGGGYLRDHYTNDINLKAGNPELTKRAKDVDIFFVPKSSVSCRVVPAATTQGFYVNYCKDASDISDMEDRGVSELIGLFNGAMSTVEYQYIVYANPMSILALAKDMDMNINQIMWDGVSEHVCISDEFFTGHRDKEIICLHDYCKIRTYYRFERMIKRHRGYTAVGCPPAPVKHYATKQSGSSCSLDMYDDEDSQYIQLG